MGLGSLPGFLSVRIPFHLYPSCNDDIRLIANRKIALASAEVTRIRSRVQLDGEPAQWLLQCLLRNRADICRKPLSAQDLGTARPADSSVATIIRQ
jgi:hypothetical protein